MAFKRALRSQSAVRGFHLGDKIISPRGFTFWLLLPFHKPRPPCCKQNQNQANSASSGTVAWCKTSSYLPAEGGEGVQALFVLGGVALLRVVPAAALRSKGRVRNGGQRCCRYLSPHASGTWTPSTQPEPHPELLIWKKRAPKDGVAQPRADPQGWRDPSPSKRSSATGAI